jgi:hypothetical protein
MLEAFIQRNYTYSDKALVLEITRKIVFNDPTQHCIVKGDKKKWGGLPKSKSLFFSPHDCGLPIGNLTSQVFANFYMHALDAFIKKELGVQYYGRYVDDFILVHRDKEYLKSLIPRISNFLRTRLQLTLHPQKIYLQHYSKGVKFLGTVIKPNRIYIANRTKGNFYVAIEKQSRVIMNHAPSKLEKASFLSSMNSYLGIMVHYKSYKLRRRLLLSRLSLKWLSHFYISKGITKFVLKSNRHKKAVVSSAKGAVFPCQCSAQFILIFFLFVFLN